MKIMNNQFSSIEQVAGQYLSEKQLPKKTTEQSEATPFAKILNEKQMTNSQESHGVRFSKHASLRLNDRNIELSNSQLDRLNAGWQKASAKGINESLVLVDQLAFIVNVKNSMVVTAMDQTEASENVFTNIDGAVIV